MDIIVESVKKIEGHLEHSGCADAGVVLDVDPGGVICQFESGASMSATFGGRSAEFTTFDPIRAPTKISFMFGAPLDTPPVRGAACAIINVILGFLCISRVLHSCQKSCHTPCWDRINQEIRGKSVFCIGSLGKIERGRSCHVTNNLPESEIILINGEGIIAMGTGDIIEKYKQTKRIICIGPSTTGIARLCEIEHWCPFGRSGLD
ncbi:MAG: hypothetical protein LUQ66_10975 [Methanoregula sp.]|nr:hypothetical protein [Methanoregula sp.]